MLGGKDFRSWGDSAHCELFPGIDSPAQLEARQGGIMHQERNYLVVSGGGANSACGAGVLKAWVSNRPSYSIRIT